VEVVRELTGLHALENIDALLGAIVSDEAGKIGPALFERLREGYEDRQLSRRQHRPTRARCQRVGLEPRRRMSNSRAFTQDSRPKT
jgi:hypothetical protein